MEYSFSGFAYEPQDEVTRNIQALHSITTDITKMSSRFWFVAINVDSLKEVFRAYDADSVCQQAVEYGDRLGLVIVKVPDNGTGKSIHVGTLWLGKTHSVGSYLFKDGYDFIGTILFENEE